MDHRSLIAVLGLLAGAGCSRKPADHVDGGLLPCDGGWHDPTSGLCWQEPPAPSTMNWDAAVAYCNSLSLGGHGPGSWRLPTISELRSLIRGCPVTETGGACGVTDSCLREGCGSWGPCNGCSLVGGPGVGGRYWPPELVAFDGWPFWSSSSASDSSSNAWGVYFNYGYVSLSDKTPSYNVRCIRRGP
jgi:formylglycine-generating enzyme required for sulfatase activity